MRSVYGYVWPCLLMVLRQQDLSRWLLPSLLALDLQKDDNAFVLYNSNTGTYNDNTTAGNEVISTNSRAVFKPQYRNYHIKAYK
jgi:hypothetical protein